MITQAQAEALGVQLEQLRCIDPAAGDGLFLYVFKEEPPDEANRFETHLKACEYCRTAREIYRYKRNVAKLLGQDSEQS